MIGTIEVGGGVHKDNSIQWVGLQFPCDRSQGVYFPPNTGGGVYFFGYYSNKQKNKQTKSWGVLTHQHHVLREVAQHGHRHNRYGGVPGRCTPSISF